MRRLVPILVLLSGTGCLYISDDEHQDQLDLRDPPCSPVVWYADDDGDGFGDVGSTTEACEAPEDYVADRTDCDDGNPDINPGVQEVCDGNDEDCDGSPDDGVQQTFYADTDVDGYGDPNASVIACAAPSGTVSDDSDCDDTDNTINPGQADDDCDGVDTNCDGTVDSDPPTWFLDFDGDAFGTPDDTVAQCQQPPTYVADNSDCDDAQFEVNPDASEFCDDVDNDCNGIVDDQALDRVPHYLDADEDGFGDETDAGILACSHPDRVTDDTDCDDADATSFPGGDDVCNDGADNDCDGEIPDSCLWPESLDAFEAESIVYGLEHNGQFSRDATVVDLDHDGVDELVVGHALYDLPGANSGGVMAFEIDQLIGTLSQADASTVVEGPEALARFGELVRNLGDLDDDGYDDWGVSNAVYNDDAGVISRRRWVFRSALTTSTSATTGRTALLQHPDIDAQSGDFIGGFDVTDDDLPDLVVAAAGEDGTFLNEGAIYVLDGDVADEVDITTGQRWHHSGPEVANQLTGAELGWSDLNNDGVVDVLVTTPGRTVGGNYTDGVVHLVVTPNTADVDLADVPYLRGRPYSDFGRSLLEEPADLTGDGIDDLLIGAEDHHVTTVLRPGAAFLIPGPIDLTAVAQPSGNDARDLAVATFEGTGHLSLTGDELSVLGDIDGDGTLDLGISGYQYSDASAGLDLAGAAYLVFGPHAGTVTLAPGPGVTEVLGMDKARMGRAMVGLGDIDGDSVDDFAVTAARTNDPTSGSADQLGAVFVFHGRAGW